MRTALIAAALVAATLCAGLSGCGQKGPLFMPNDNATPTRTLASQSSFQSFSQ